MKLSCAMSIWVTLFSVISGELSGQQGNQVLQAYVMNGKSAAQLQQELSDKSKVQVDGLVEMLDLDEQQASKLMLACRGDIVRWFQDVAELDMHTKDIDLQTTQQNQEEMQRIWPMVMPARQQLETGLHGHGSLLDKTLMSLLTNEQVAQLQEQTRQKQHRKMRAVCKLTLIELEKQVPLTQKQRDGIMELVDQLPMPKMMQDQMMYYVGLAVLAKIPEKQLAEVLNDQQFKLLSKALRNADNVLRQGAIQW